MLLKHASNVPQSAARFEALMREAGLPEGAGEDGLLTPMGPVLDGTP